jgi:hypothetical protein
MKATSVLVLAWLVAFSAAASNLPQLVNLRIEGASNHTIFEAPILTRGHNVTTASGGNHHCDGTNLNANPTPGATCTSALDDAAHLAHFTFDGYVASVNSISSDIKASSLACSTFDTEFDDFFITRIAGSAETATQFWGLLLNFQFTPVGGCQQEVKFKDEVLWAFDAFNAAHFLKLSSPSNVIHVHKPVEFTVVDGLTGIPVSGVDVKVRRLQGVTCIKLTLLYRVDPRYSVHPMRMGTSRLHSIHQVLSH